MSSDLVDEAQHMARVTAHQTTLVDEAADEIEKCRAFSADRERQRRQVRPVTSAIILQFPQRNGTR
jgi:hypothetical protein